MMCCCRDAEEQDGTAMRDRADPGIEEQPTASRVVRLATIDDDLISSVDMEQLTNNRSKNRPLHRFAPQNILYSSLFTKKKR